MSRQITQPINQVKLTNVAVVRCNKHGKRFEIACYRNKIMDYRSGLEKDIGEVLQTDRIFVNVSKGEFARAADLEKAFGTRDQEEIAKIILDQSPKQQSDFQVSDLERAQVIKDTLSQIATWISQNCVHADGSDRPFPTSQVKDALGKNYIVHPHKAIKKQCLDAVKYLKTVMPIERAKMELQLQYASEHEKDIQSALSIHDHRLVRSESTEDQNTVVIQVDPSLYRDFSALVSQVHGNLEILEQVVMSREGEIDLEQQLEINSRKQQESKANYQHESNDEGQDSDVEDIAEKLQALRATKPANNENNRDAILGINQGLSDDDDDFYSGSGAAVGRKNNKKNKKKSKKQRRREQEEEEARQRLAESERQRAAERQNEASEVAVANAKSMESSQAVSGSKSCNSCGGSFANAADYRAHFRSDWHRFNQKLKLKGVAPVSEEEFLLCDAETFFS